MSKENLEQFATQIADSEELRASIENQLDSDGNISADTLIALGTEHGFEFTVEDLAENAELRDEELDGVAGGTYEVLPAIHSSVMFGFSSLKLNLSPIEIEGLQLEHPHRREFKGTTT